MGYYMRFIVTDKHVLDLSSIEAALRQLDSLYSISDREAESGTLVYGSEPYGRLEVNHNGDETFKSEMEELKEEVEETNGKMTKRVIDALKNAKSVVAVQVLFGERETEVTLRRIDPLWKWLFSNREGLMQADEEGYYDKHGLILKVPAD